MLQTLHVRDLALIGRAEIRFDRGLNVLSGPTGGGKSLIVTALNLLRGEKAAGGLVRHGADELRIDGEFILNDPGQARTERGVGARTASVLDAVREVSGGGDPEGGVLVVTRIVDTRGRSKVRIDGRPATLQDLREVCGHLLEIHGQGEARALMRPEIQAETLDAFGGTSGLRQSFARRLAAARQAAADLEAAASGARERQARVEFLRFQLAEMDELGLDEGEVERVESEHQVLAHLDRLRESLGVALDALRDGDDSASDRLACAGRALDDAAEVDRALAPVCELVADAQEQLAEAVRLLVSRAADLDLDPAALGAVEERLGVIRRGLARFGPAEADYFRRRAAARAELGALDAGDREPDALEVAYRAALAALETDARRLCRGRRKAGPRFVAAIEAELADLGMPHTAVQLGMADDVPIGHELVDRATPHGPVPVDIEVRINPGEPFRSMRDTASGGESARIVLAIKKCLADRDRVPMVVFDEIDAEIGGRLGLHVGRKLREVSVDHQTVIVTHLPQVAAFADAHFRVDKEIRQDRTWTAVTALDDAGRELELAAMAAGDGADPDAVAEARRLVARVRRPDEAAERASRPRRAGGAAARGGAPGPKPLQIGDLSSGG